MPPIRVSAKAIVIQDGCLLATRHVDAEGDWYLLPGGGMHHGETAAQAVVRECAEETGALVEVGDLRLVRGYIGRHHEFARADHDAHQVELMFEARLVGNYAPGCGPVPDSSQVGVAWLPLAELGRHRLYPSVLRELLASGPAGPGEPGTAGVYLGDVN